MIQDCSSVVLWGQGNSTPKVLPEPIFDSTPIVPFIFSTIDLHMGSLKATP